ncbi:MAG: hypothetical protein WC761_01620 [Candidatus Paceibacterota bacterium]|jgi:hypothetical protein
MDEDKDPVPGAVLAFYVFVFYIFFAVSGCGDWTFTVGRPTRNPISARAIPPDSTSCPVEFRPWNEACDNR